MNKTISYFELVKPTYIENWPAELCSLSIAQVDIPLTIDDARRLGSNINELGETFGEFADIDDIHEKIDAAIRRFPQGAFIRLGSRSPKDSYYGYKNGFRVINGLEALKLLLDTSERIYEDLHLAIIENYNPHIFIRAWQEIPEWSEFRCFMQNKKLIGISQYNYLKKTYYSEIENNCLSIPWIIKQYFNNSFSKVIHLDDVIFDIWIKRIGKDEERTWEVKLIEINPFFKMTDPCLFDWRIKFNRTFRFNDKGGKIKSINI